MNKRSEIVGPDGTGYVTATESGSTSLLSVSINGHKVAERHIDIRELYKPDRLDLLSFIGHWIVGIFLILVFLGIAAFSLVRFFSGAGTDGLIVTGVCALIAGVWFWRVKP